MQVLSLDQEDPLEKDMAIHSQANFPFVWEMGNFSCLGNPME